MMVNHFQKNQKAYQYLLLLLLCYAVFLLKLGSFHLRFWDESMFAVNTYEMMKNGQYFSLFFDGQPDLFNTKPPLTIWAQLLSVQLLGYNELAIRLPSALASTVSVIALFGFLSKNFSYQFAWIAALILMTSHGYVGFHTSRTGDSDALLSCFLLLANLQLFSFFYQRRKSTIFWFFFLMTLAALTKLFAAFLFIPGVIVIVMWQKKVREIVYSWQFIVGCLGLLALPLIVMYLREIENPGYLAIAFGKDAGRLFEVVENHDETPFYYLDLLFNRQFGFYILLSTIGIMISFWSAKHVKTLLVGASLLVLSYLLVISISITKLHWYTMPLFPMLAFLAAYPIHLGLQSILIENNVLTPFKKGVAILVLFIYPLIIMFNKSQGNSIVLGERTLESKELYLFNKIKQKQNLNGLKILHHNWKGSLLFYKYKLAESDQNIYIETNAERLEKGDLVLVSQDSLKNVLKTFYPNLYEVDSYESASLYSLNP